MSRSRQIRKLARQALEVKREICDKFAAGACAEYDVPCVGCKLDGCCRQVVATTTFEAIVILDELRKARRHDLLATLIDQGEAILPDWQAAAPDPIALEGVSTKWFGQLCALHEGGRCSIYKVRPATCALYYIVGDPSLCGPPAGKIVPSADSTTAQAYVMMLDHSFCSQIGIEPFPPMPLGMAVGYALQLLGWKR